MSKIWWIGGLAAPLAFSLGACQYHLPALETSPRLTADGSAPRSAPKIDDIVNHLRCELHSIVDFSSKYAVVINNLSPTLGQPGERGKVRELSDNAEAYSMTLASRLKADPLLAPRLKYLLTDKFVATVQLTLEVTDTEGFTPALSYLKPWSSSTGFTFGGGLQLNGTQDRSLTTSYSIDLDALNKDADLDATYCKDKEWFWKQIGTNGGVARDLGLADIIADGLTAIDLTAKDNLYASAGQFTLGVTFHASPSGNIKKSDPNSSGTMKLDGTMILQPPAAGTIGPTSVSFYGTTTINIANAQASYISNLTGYVLAPGTNGNPSQAIDLSGSLARSSMQEAASGLDSLGLNPTLNLQGDVSAGTRSIPPSIHLTGVLINSTPTPTVDPLQLKTPVIFNVKLEEPTSDLGATTSPPSTPPSAPDKGALFTQSAALTGGKPSATSAAAGTASTGTSFGSIVDFTLVYGANGGPNWTLTNFKGPGGGGGSSGSSGASGGGASGQLFSMSRTNLDTLTVTFVPSCHDDPSPSTPKSFWDTVPQCNGTGAEFAGAVDRGTSANALMFFNRFQPSAVTRP